MDGSRVCLRLLLLYQHTHRQVRMPTTEIAGFPLIDGVTMAAIDDDPKCEAALRIQEWSDCVRRQKGYHAASYGTVSESPSDLVAVISMCIDLPVSRVQVWLTGTLS